MSENQEGLFYQLFLRKWHPHPTIPCAMIIFAMVGSFFLILGIVINVINSNIVEVRIPNYHQLDTCKQTSDCNTANNDCYFKDYFQVSSVVNFTSCPNPNTSASPAFPFPCSLEKFKPIEYRNCSFTKELPNMDGPVYIFYELSNFYQNHRKYVKSKGNAQLAGQSFSQSDANKACDPVSYNGHIQPYQRIYYIDQQGYYVPRHADKSYPTSELKDQNTANPCGLIAKSFFNDTFSIIDLTTNNSVKIDETGITWPNDKGSKFKQGDRQLQWINAENEHFIVWMKTSGLPEFRKIWGRVDEGFHNKTYKFVIGNYYDPSIFGGSKNLVLSTAGPFGGKNVFLGIAYIIAGCLCMIIAIFFWFQGKFGGKNYGRKDE